MSAFGACENPCWATAPDYRLLENPSKKDLPDARSLERAADFVQTVGLATGNVDGTCVDHYNACPKHGVEAFTPTRVIIVTLWPREHEVTNQA